MSGADTRTSPCLKSQFLSPSVISKAPRSTKEWIKQRHAMQELKATTERQAATIALQESQIKSLTASLKEQANQIQKVSAQLEMIKPAPQVVENR